MRLVDLDPHWIMKDGLRVGFTFLSPSGKQGNTHWRQSCFIVAMPSDAQDELLGESRVQHCKPACAWTVTGGIENATFETMTVTPSIDGIAGGLWHGFITNGDIK